MKNLYIRCAEETYELAHALAKKENRSLNKQIIHMIHSMADANDVVVNSEPTPVEDVSVDSQEVKLVGLQSLAETMKQETVD